ncbi:hypothetical protein Q8W71_31645 [Methylobacterium sp. NEAU 140]|nr:hypothetical protein [Methylobacterium sp. NEAU 140]MDP4027136.1 hypothetical protein [Methylobacterium sp. NEAU 140]
MEEGVVPQRIWIVFEVAASRFDEGLELGHRLEVLVDDGLVDEAPEVLCGLEFGRVGRQVDEPQAVGHAQSRFGVPTGPIKQQDERALGACTGLAGEGSQQALEQRLGDTVADVPVALAGGRRHEGGDIEPLVAVMAERGRPLPARGPDPAGDRLQPNPVLVGAEDRDWAAGMTRFFLGERGGEFF